MKKQNPNQPEHNETVVPVRSGIKENFVAPTSLDSKDRNYSFKLVVSALVVLASLALGVIFLLPGWVAEQVPTTEMVEQSVPPSESNSGVLAISPNSAKVSGSCCSGVRNSGKLAMILAESEISRVSTDTPADLVNASTMGNREYVAKAGASSVSV